MPRTRSLAWSELKIGVLAVMALVIASVFIFMVGGQGGFFWQRYRLKTKFQDVQGLKDGAVVRVAGVEVGTVTRVEFAGSEVDIGMELSNDMKSRITTESRASLGSLSLLGEPVIDISPGRGGTPLPEDAYIQSVPPAGQLRDVAATATKGLEEATRLLQDIRSGKGTVGRLFTDEALYREMNQFVDAASQVANNLGQGRGTIGMLLKDPRAYQSLDTSLANLSRITERINAGEGSLGRLIHDSKVADSLASMTGKFDELATKINTGGGTAGKLINDPELYNRLNSLSGRLDSLLTALNSGEGTAGQLVRNRQLYENMNGAVSELRTLVSEIRKNPKKYLNVRVSIF
jgi:phospholipid/cholesterol/gamma-HCH transport system substrate-binding protein